jgi:hypothetical protein
MGILGICLLWEYFQTHLWFNFVSIAMWAYEILGFFFFFWQHWGLNSVPARQALYRLSHSASPGIFFFLTYRCQLSNSQVSWPNYWVVSSTVSVFWNPFPLYLNKIHLCFHVSKYCLPFFFFSTGKKKYRALCLPGKCHTAWAMFPALQLFSLN